MSKLRNLNVGTKIGLGFGLSTLILMGVVLTTIHQVKNMESITKRVVETRTPTAHASLMMLNGMNHSLATLRGWIILGDDKFKVERERTWAEQIDPSLKDLEKLSSHWTDQENIARLAVIKTEIENFRKYQQKIEDIAQSADNTPARKILLEKADPLEKIIMSNITFMVKNQMRAARNSSQEKVMGMLVDIETGTSLAMEKVEEFLLSGDTHFKTEYLTNWKKSSQKIEILKSNVFLLTRSQKEAFEKLVQARDQLGLLLQNIVNIRSGEKWNMANYLLATEAAPTSSRIKMKLNEMSDSQEELLELDVQEVSNRTHFLITLLVLLFVASALISGVLGSSITRAISKPIQKASILAHELALGNFRQKRLPVQSKDELGALNESFNQLLDRLQSKNPTHRDS